MRRRPRIELRIVDADSSVEYVTAKHFVPTEAQYEAARRLLLELLRPAVAAVAADLLEQVRESGAFEGWPADRPPRYNGSGTPCDMLVGPCCCGATHLGED